MRNTNGKKEGFTLIELLIVVAIIGILAAIAVPNFLNAQVRAKIARCISDMKSLSTALEMYRLDNNTYPTWTRSIVPGSGDYTHPNEIRFYRMTTPVSYITSIPVDPFATYANQSDFATWGWAYDYVDNLNNTDPNQGWGHVWRLNSWGPDNINSWGGQRDGACPNGIPNFLYQTSNGLNSYGDIVWVGAKSPGATVFCNIQNGV
ncbi:MAG: prepilin-type N-terminal cleavage/methylation domain-containing protein [Candidatus Omnitrophota bacterium]|jgi:type II secretion system protein G|nr:MAG: prepilin-type N-terminal cleavage/methylation domain-containing protein [Candidatus Omnitrophota bacterium]